eukprot:c8720_g1_i1.p1 GENE.c8720_g1_i1~~c8720_g1_i1.p1  ORF type:complete len:811 (+),score=149.91 c8720_g1_i1:114-2546(+)
MGKKRRRDADEAPEAPAEEPQHEIKATRDWDADENSGTESDAPAPDAIVDAFDEIDSADGNDDSSDDGGLESMDVDSSSSDGGGPASAAAAGAAAAAPGPRRVRGVTFPHAAITTSLSSLPAGGELFLTALRQRTRPGYRSAYDFGLPVEGALENEQIDALRREQLRAADLVAESSADDDDDDMHKANTLGDIPLEWYDDFVHMGYDLDGKKIPKKTDGAAAADAIDRYISQTDNPDYWRTIYDKFNQKDVVLSPKEMEMIRRMQKGQYADMAFDPYEDWESFFAFKDSAHPLVNKPEPKSRFVPSKWEAQKVAKIVRAIREGRIKPKVRQEEPLYDLWASEEVAAPLAGIPAPKAKLPTNAESYNPPDEYLFDDEEKAQFEALDPEDRPIDFLPRKYDALRKVPAYPRFVDERFERCLDLYLCPRARKRRFDIEQSDLLPKLPKPQDLRPFPSKLAMVYSGHTSKVRSIDPSPSGQWLVSGSNDGAVRLWEVDTGRSLRLWEFGEVVHSVQWCPNPARALFAVAVGSRVVFINPGLGAPDVVAETDELCFNGLDSAFVEDDHAAKLAAKTDRKSAGWRGATRAELLRNIRAVVELPSAVQSIAWHHRGDYLASISPDGGKRAVLIHQFSKKRSQAPFGKSANEVQRVAFHPTEPFFFVATKRYVHVYDLEKQSRIKKLMTGFNWVSTLCIHPSGNHVIVGSYDSKVAWFDLDYSDKKPYRVLRYHRFAVRGLDFHPRFPLFASCSDDGTVQVFHGRVFADYMQDPMIVPLKILRGHKITDKIGVIDCAFHPKQPWLFSAAADTEIHLYV